MQSRAALIRDLILIPVPFFLLAVGFFVAGVTEGVVLMLICAVAGAWFVWPREQRQPGAVDAMPPEQVPPAGTGGGGPV